MTEYEELMSVERVNEWLDRTDLEYGYTFANRFFIEQYHKRWIALKREARRLYMCGVAMENYSLAKMMYSAKKQAKFCEAVKVEAGNKKILPVHYPVFEKNLKSLDDRIKYIRLITSENLRRTKYGPFFATLSEADYENIDNIEVEEFKSIADKWNEEHKDIVAKHLEDIKEELETYQKHREEVRAKIKDEIAAEKLAKKQEDEYVKELQKNAKVEKRRRRKIEREFEYIYKGEKQ